MARYSSKAFVYLGRPKAVERQTIRFECGPRDLVVEILSPSTEERDRGIKSQLYCRYGVQEYWLVDPEERTVEVLALSSEGYQVLGQYSEDEVVSSRVLVGFQFPAEEIFD